MAGSPSRGRSSPNRTTKHAFDEERLEWDAVSRWSTWPKKLRLPRLRRSTAALPLIDFIIVVLLICAFKPLIILLLRNEELFGARLTLPLNAPPPSGDVDQHTYEIPRILHQTSATTKVPEAWTDLVKSCRETYSDFEYKHWTDELARDFIEAEYPWFLETWDNFPFPIQRADAIRYFILYHYGGIYLDMDTLCNETIPLHQIEADGAPHHAIFKSTTPTGVSNDFMISSAHHPLFRAAIFQLIWFNDVTTMWAQWLPHVAIMISAGPFFITQVAKNYLLEEPTLPTPAVQVINATELAPYITDFEGQSWHHGDTKTLMWVGEHPWVWFALGAAGLAVGLYIFNNLLLLAWRYINRASLNSDNSSKMVKLI